MKFEWDIATNLVCALYHRDYYNRSGLSVRQQGLEFLKV